MQLQLAEKDAALATKDAALATKDAALAEKDAAKVENDAAAVEKVAAWADKSAKWAEGEAARVKAENARAVQMSIPAVAGRAWHDKAISWLRSIGITVTNTHTTGHSGDAIITLPGCPDMRILLDFKAGTLANRGPG